MGVTVGILATGTYIPNQKIKSDEIASISEVSRATITGKLGLLEKPIANDQETVSYMGAQASIQALKKAKLQATEIDLILSISSENKSYLFQSSAHKMQQLIGADRAWGIDLAQHNCTLISALAIAKRMMQSDPALQTVLVAGGTRDHECVNLEDQTTQFLYAVSAGGGAIILKRNHHRNLLWGSALLSDASCVDDVYKDHQQSAYIQIHQAAHFELMVQNLFKKNLQQVIENAIVCSEESKAIDYLAMMHLQRSTHVKILRELGLRLDQSYYLERYGQMGALDPILSIELGLQAQRIQEGSMIVMACVGFGYTWGAQVIQWG